MPTQHSKLDSAINGGAIPYNIYSNLADFLNGSSGSGSSAVWRELISKITEPQFAIPPYDIEHRIAREAQMRGGNPALQLLQVYSQAGMTVGQLVKFLEKLEAPPESFLMHYKPFEPIVIRSAPPPTINKEEGEYLELHCKATSFPFPHYQWFKGKEELIGEHNEKYIIAVVQKEHEGEYCCRVAKAVRRGEPPAYEFTKPTQVIVTPNLRNLFKDPPLPNHRSSPIVPPPDFSYRFEPLIYTPKCAVNKRQSFNQPVMFVCRAQGDRLKYQWRKDGEDIPGATSQDYSIISTLANSGSYTCKVTNAYLQASAVSPPYVLEVVQDVAGEEEKELEFVYIRPSVAERLAGDEATFECFARGPRQVAYQWYHDGKQIPGATQRQLHLPHVGRRDEGEYKCMASCDDASHVISTTVKLKVSRDTNLEPIANKLALLIGEGDYEMGEDTEKYRLPAAKTDVSEFSKVLKALGFTVYAYYNLNYTEIMNAVHHFCKQLCDDVYVVFYFIGHGYHHYGQEYLMPCDLHPFPHTTEGSVCAQYILHCIQKQYKTAMTVMILDTCRKTHHSIKSDHVPEIHKYEQRANIVKYFATSEFLNSYEEKGNGVLMTFLLAYIRDCLGENQSFPKKPSMVDMFTAVCKSVRDAVERRDHKYDMQPQCVYNIPEYSERSLFDPCYHQLHPHHVDSQWRQHALCHKMPDPFMLQYITAGITMHFECTEVLSNVMHVSVILSNAGIAKDFDIQKSVAPAEVQVAMMQPKEYPKYIIEISGIQRLERTQDLEIELHGVFKYEGNPHPQFRTFNIPLGRPLTANLGLGLSRPLDQ